MLLAIDIGNSSIDLGVFDADGKLCVTSKISSLCPRSPDEYAVLTDGILRLNHIDRSDITYCILCSVVPSLTAPVREAVTRLTGILPPEVGPGMKTGLRIHVDDPTQLGADLVANAVAALAVLPPPFVVIDVGSATTFTVVDEKGSLEGVIIAPGVRMSLHALSTDAAKLSDVSLVPPRQLIARNTRDSMNAGVLYGHAMMIDGMLYGIAREMKLASVPGILTGGLAGVVLPCCTHSMLHKPELTLTGLLEIYRKNRK